MILFRNVSLSRRKSTTRFGRSPFFRRKVAMFIGRETKTHFTDENQRKIDKVSASNNNYSCIIINHSTTTTNNNDITSGDECSNCNISSTQTEREDIQSFDWCVGKERFFKVFQMKVITLKQLGNEENQSIWLTVVGSHTEEACASC